MDAALLRNPATINLQQSLDIRHILEMSRTARSPMATMMEGTGHNASDADSRKRMGIEVRIITIVVAIRHSQMMNQ